VIRSNVRLHPQPLKLGDAEDVLLAPPACEEPDLVTFHQFLGQQVKRRQPDSTANQDLLLLLILTEIETLAERSNDIKRIPLMEIGQHPGTAPDHLVQYLQKGLVAAVGERGYESSHIIDAERTAKQRIDRPAHLYHHELAG